MSFHVKRSITAPHDTLYQRNGVRSTRWVRPDHGRSVLEIQTMHKPSVFLNVPDDKNEMKPLYHWHWYQEEYFHVRAGRFIFTLEGVDKTVTPSDPQPVVIPPRARHTFAADPTYDGECTIEISTEVSPLSSSATDTEDHGVSEKFFRNIYSYLDDCHSQGVEPSLPQLLLFVDAAEVSAAFPWGPDWLMRSVSYAMGVVVGRWFGGWVLGYKASYPEYFDEKKTR